MNSRMVGVILLGGIGLTFLGQGLGFMPGSFMTGDLTWAVVGAVMVVVAVALLLRTKRSG